MAEELPLATGSVDVAMCHMLLHHVVSPRTALRVHTLLVEDAGISHSGNFIGKAADFMNFLLLGQVGERGSTDRAHDRRTWTGAQARVIDVRRQGETIWHQVEGPIPLEGTRMHGLLDWSHRYALMRAHTALHILCGVIWRDYEAHVTSSSMEPGRARQDFELERLTLDFVTEVEQRVNAEIEANREVRIRFSPRAEAFTLPDLIRTRVNLLPEGIEVVRVCEIVGLLLWGTNVLTSHHHLWKFLLAARRAGAYLVAIDPLRTRTAAQADEHLALLPGTDAALALGLMHVIVALGAEDRTFLAAYTLGWQPFRERLARLPPERVAALTGIDECSIVKLGERIATTRPTAIRATMDLQRHAGGGLLYSTGNAFPANLAALWRDDLRTHPARTLVMTHLGEELTQRSDPAVQALIIYASNPLASVPEQHTIRQGLSREESFTVVIEQFPTDTMNYADAEKRSLKDGDKVRVFNDRGSFIALAEITDRVRLGVVATTKGYWPKDLEQGTNINATVAGRDADIGSGAVFHDNRVEVTLAL